MKKKEKKKRRKKDLRKTTSRKMRKILMMRMRQIQEAQYCAVQAIEDDRKTANMREYPHAFVLLHKREAIAIARNAGEHADKRKEENHC